ncbi:hypothetical protein NLG42_11615 [Flavobacterium plurextorum]|uniref:hypothetical protein n=1 Tax=Flavobacterium TaxID=237 RepID=UPI00214D9A46|nr:MULTISPECIES: hypothetical protein [Flavobacterium]UUW11428.1 hypothetical protein NLG42_11615 [Flavobacterium plurextorum]
MDIWKEFAKETNSTFKEGYSWHSDSVSVQYKNWKIVFDNYTLWSGKYSAETTRVIVPISLKGEFKFEVYNEGFIRKVEKLFGAQDIEIGFPDFDKAFTIKSNNEAKIKALLRNKEIRDLISSQKEVNIQICNRKGIWEEKLPENEFELSFYADGKITNIEILKSINLLFKTLLDKLYETNSIN